MKTKHDYSVEVFVICATVMFLTGVSAGWFWRFLSHSGFPRIVWSLIVSFESHVTTLAIDAANKAAEFAFRHPVFLDDAIKKNVISQGAAARLLQEQPNCPDIPQMMRTIIKTEKSIHRTLMMAVVSEFN